MTSVTGLHDSQALQGECEQTAAQLYNAELALHCAHQAHVDAWISAASDRLHEAVVAHLRATTDRSRSNGRNGS
jgi:hypothetical protein